MLARDPSWQACCEAVQSASLLGEAGGRAAEVADGGADGGFEDGGAGVVIVVGEGADFIV